VSSSPELAPEREAVGQAAAEIPVLVGWEIKHTPGPGDDAAQAMEVVRECDLFMVILGSDFAAPMGLEWQLAPTVGTAFLPYRKRVMRSPSAQSLLRRSDADWVSFEDATEFRARVAADLAQTVLDQGEQFGLQLDEVEALVAWLRAQREADRGGPDERRGAERGGVILGRGGRVAPSSAGGEVAP
jgi:hypothetical protein